MAEETEDSGTDKSSLKPAQLAASALAAVTAAFLGSTLGVGGTIAGAGIASVVTTVGGELYLRSLRKTRAAARKTAKVLALTDTRLRQETSAVEPPPRRPDNPLMRPVPPTRGRLPARQLNQIQRTARVPMAGHGSSGFGERTVYIPGNGNRPPTPPGRRIPPTQQIGPRTPQNGLRPGQTSQFGPQGTPPGPRSPQSGPHTARTPEPGADAATRLVSPSEQPRNGAPSGKPWWKNRWTLIVGTSVVAFVVGMLVLTGFESITGHAVSGGQGTTFSQVVRGSSTGGGEDSTPTEQPTTATKTHTSDATPTESSTEQTGGSSASSTPTQQAPAPRSTVQQTQSAQPTESAAPTSG
ncbi:MAG TPA: hypothetical protein VHC18_06135 [Amycolatopsis sp.]|nr:hypothetical protein [Amycolatopsis sp.]